MQQKNGWKKDTDSKDFIHYVRYNQGECNGVISSNYRPLSRVWDFSYFPMGNKVKDKHFKKENLTKTKALKFAKEYMQKNQVGEVA